MKTWLNEYFGFSKREYNGLLALVFILLIISVLPYLLAYFKQISPIISASEQISIKKLEIVSQQQNNHFATVRNQIEDKELVHPTSLFKFDPNLIDQQDWQKLGLSAKQAQSIINYRNKGGKFYKPADLQKMYTISAKKFQELMPYISIQQSNHYPDKSVFKENSTFAKKELVIVEINTADTTQLTEIKGIGPAFARRIAKYREKLGGFNTKEQLMEVYGLDSLKFKEIKNQIRINPLNLTKININTAEFNDLKNHPYLTYKQINALINYRKQHGKFLSIDDLKKVIILSPQTIQNLTPYLTF